MPSVSVVVPVLDDARELERCLAALAAQTRPPDEVVVVDNGSTDGSAEVARAMGAVVVHESVRGIPAASARGYDRARGDLLVRLDADSVPPVDWIERAVRPFARSDVVAVTAPGVPSDAGKLLAAVWDAVYMRPYFVLMHGALARPPLFGSAMVIRRSTWIAVRSRVHRADSEVHDDVDLSMLLDPAWHVVLDRDLALHVSSRPLSDVHGIPLRARRAFHTFRVNGRRANPVRRWARRLRAAARARTWYRDR
jgi:glycosyltransferase involved in cell wall biosynthesis